MTLTAVFISIHHPNFFLRHQDTFVFLHCVNLPILIKTKNFKRHEFSIEGCALVYHVFVGSINFVHVHTPPPTEKLPQSPRNVLKWLRSPLRANLGDNPRRTKIEKG